MEDLSPLQLRVVGLNFQNLGISFWASNFESVALERQNYEHLSVLPFPSVIW